MKVERKFVPFLLPVRCLMFLLVFVLLSIITKLPYDSLSRWWTAIAIVCNVITIAILWMFSYKKGISYKELLNYEKGKTSFKSCFIIVFIILVVGMSGLFLTGLICYQKIPYLDKTLVQPIPMWLAIIVLLLLPISTTLAEDGLYLGYAIHLRGSQKWINVLVSAFFYALQHCFIPFLPNGIFVLYRFISFLPLTLLICFWYQKNHNPVPVMIGHFILNVATAVQIIIMTILPDLFLAL